MRRRTRRPRNTHHSRWGSRGQGVRRVDIGTAQRGSSYLCFVGNGGWRSEMGVVTCWFTEKKCHKQTPPKFNCRNGTGHRDAWFQELPNRNVQIQVEFSFLLFLLEFTLSRMFPREMSCTNRMYLLTRHIDTCTLGHLERAKIYKRFCCANHRISCECC